MHRSSHNPATEGQERGGWKGVGGYSTYEVDDYSPVSARWGFAGFHRFSILPLGARTEVERDALMLRERGSMLAAA